MIVLRLLPRTTAHKGQWVNPTRSELIASIEGLAPEIVALPGSPGPQGQQGIQGPEIDIFTLPLAP